MNDGVKKPVCRFVAESRGLVLNATNYDTLAQMAKSDDTDLWPGLKIQLFADRANYAGKDVAGIRIRPVATKTAPKAAPPNADPWENYHDGMGPAPPSEDPGAGLSDDGGRPS
jgi:hypothetical protein